MSTEISKPPQSPTANVRGLLEKMKPQLQAALPGQLDAGRMIRTVMTTIQKNDKLLECSASSLLGAVVQAAQLGLDCDGVLGQAYLIPYGNTCQLIVGYQGLIDLVRRSGQVSTFLVKEVYEKDFFEYSFGLNPDLKHTQSREKDRGPIIFVYATAKMCDGGDQFEVMNFDEIEVIRIGSKSGNHGPWKDNWTAMAKKTVLRRLCKLLPVSVETKRAVAIDENDNRTIPPINLGSELGLPDSEPLRLEPTPPETLDDLTKQTKKDTE